MYFRKDEAPIRAKSDGRVCSCGMEHCGGFI